jgi:transposase InsO family protein
MARSTFQYEKPVESYLKPNTFMHWQGHTYRILSRDLRTVTIQDILSLEAESQTIEVVDLVVPEGESPPVFAPTLEKLSERLQKLLPPPERSADADLPRPLKDKAQLMVKKYKKIERLLAEKKDLKEKAGDTFHRTLALEAICQLAEIDISVATYYNYRNRYHEYNGDQAAIAGSFRRPRSYGHSRLADAQLHLVDSAIVKYYMRKPRLRKVTLYEHIKSTHKRTHGLWIDPGQCEGEVPQDLVSQLFDDTLPMQAIVDNPEKKRWLVPIEEPRRTSVYDRINALEQRPDEGKAIIVARYGEEMWEYEQMIFDHFAHIATRPLQYVFADYCLLKVFIVDRETRSELDRLWLTLLIDAYSRSVVGWTLTYEQPCIDAIQDALLNTITPKNSELTRLGIEGEWPCYGIPLQLSLDNAWSNHSHSLETLASMISMDGEYSSIDLVFRKPYKARQGALIERFFRGLAAVIKERLKGAIQSSHPKDIRNAAEEACLLFEDVYRFLLEEFVAYQNRPHSELQKMTPNQKWEQGMQSIPPAVPPLTEKVKRYFWREYHQTRTIQDKGIGLFNMHYWSPKLGTSKAPKFEENEPDELVEYAIRYDPTDISCIALFRNRHYVDDVKAKELRLSNNEYRSVSLWERELSKDLARSDGSASRDWVAYLNNIRELNETRTAEKKAAQRAAKRLTSRSSSRSKSSKHENVQRVNEAVNQITTPQNREYKNRLARFSAHKTR